MGDADRVILGARAVVAASFVAEMRWYHDLRQHTSIPALHLQ
jgi:hypothetical protein